MGVLVTRPDERGMQLCVALNQHGMASIHFPLFEFLPGVQLNLLANKLKQLRAGDYIFFVSKSAVDFSHIFLKQVGYQWRNDINYVTVGKQTARYFCEQTTLPIEYPIKTETSEGSLALLPQDLTEKKFLILRGNGGRNYLGEQVALRGANVEWLECYQRQRLPHHWQEKVSLFKRAGIDKILITSSEILQYLVDSIPKEEYSWFLSCQLIVVGERLAKQVTNLGFQHIIISAKADNQHLLDTILSNA